jgi:hypothetical protein
MATAHPLAGRENLDLSAFSGQTFLLPDMEESPGRGAAMLAICNELGIKDITIKTVESVEFMLFGIRCGARIGFVSMANDLVFDDHYFYFRVPKISFGRRVGNSKLLIGEPVTAEHRVNALTVGVFVKQAVPPSTFLPA